MANSVYSTREQRDGEMPCRTWPAKQTADFTSPRRRSSNTIEVPMDISPQSSPILCPADNTSIYLMLNQLLLQKSVASSEEVKEKLQRAITSLTNAASENKEAECDTEVECSGQRAGASGIRSTLTKLNDHDDTKQGIGRAEKHSIPSTQVTTSKATDNSKQNKEHLSNIARSETSPEMRVKSEDTHKIDKPKTARLFHGRTLLIGVAPRRIPIEAIYIKFPIKPSGNPETVPQDPRPEHYEKKARSGMGQKEKYKADLTRVSYDYNPVLIEQKDAKFGSREAVQNEYDISVPDDLYKGVMTIMHNLEHAILREKQEDTNKKVDRALTVPSHEVSNARHTLMPYISPMSSLHVPLHVLPVACL